MSKSIKKHLGFTRVGDSAKEDKARYNAQSRAKTKRILKDAVKTENLDEVDELTDKIDYSLPKSDSASWSTDGKVYVSENTLHQWFMRELESKNFMAYYQFYCENEPSILPTTIAKCIFEVIGKDLPDLESVRKASFYNEKKILAKFRKLMENK